MSTRQLLNMALGSVALLLVASASLVWNQGHSGQFTDEQIDLAQRQQVTIQDLGRQIDALQVAEDLNTVTEARQRVGQAVLQFDRSLAALVNGGFAPSIDGHEYPIPKIKGGKARKALDKAVVIWRDTGTPLANLAAGEFSIYSAAGQDAVQGLNDNTLFLMEQMGNIANALRAGAVARQAIARIAAWGTGILCVFLIGLIWLRIREGKTKPATTNEEKMAPSAPREQAAHLAAALTPPSADPPVSTLTPKASYLPPHQPSPPAGDNNVFNSPLDFDSVNATVDQMTVDMNTIASSTDKMQLAIDSVGHALQGMLYSLKEMSQDTAEGHKIVRGANNAASFTAQAAEDLVASAREMSQVVGRVTQLALRTRQVAAQIDAEAVGTGQTGEAFTSVVATEVKGLAKQTSQATLEIENTVSTILTTARQYEEAIGQIIKNISSINKVSQHLGELMLTPPTTVVPGTPPPAPLTPAVAPVPVPTPVAQAPAPVPVPPVEAPDPFVQPETPPTESADEPVVPKAPLEPKVDSKPLSQPKTTETKAEMPTPAAPFSLEDDDEPPAPSLEEVAQETSEVIEELGLDDLPPAAEEEEAPVAPSDSAEPSEIAPPPPTPTLDPEPEAAAPETKEAKPLGSNANVFMLNKPKEPLKLSPKDKVEEADLADSTPEEPAPEAAAEPESIPEANTQIEEAIAPQKDPTPNIYELKMPDPDAKIEIEEEPNEDAVIGGAEPEEAPEEAAPKKPAPAADSSKAKPTVFMLNKPKKKVTQ